MLLGSDPVKFFTEPHYNGFPAVLVRLPEVGEDELRELITDAWRCQARAAWSRQAACSGQGGPARALGQGQPT